MRLKGSPRDRRKAAGKVTHQQPGVSSPYGQMQHTSPTIARKRIALRADAKRNEYDAGLKHPMLASLLGAQLAFLVLTIAIYIYWDTSRVDAPLRSATPFVPLAAYAVLVAMGSLIFWWCDRRSGQSLPRTFEHTFAALLGLSGALFASEINLREPAADSIRMAVLLLWGAGLFLMSPVASAVYVVSATMTLLYVTSHVDAGATIACAMCAGWAYTVAALYRRRAAQQAFKMREFEERAKTSEELIAGFEEGGNHWLWEIDADNRFKYASPRLATLLMCDPQTIIGQDIWKLLAGYARSEGKQSPLHTLQFYISARLPFQDLVLPLRVREEERWFSISGGPLVDSKGQFAGYCGVGTDLTSTRQAEEQARNLALFDSLTGLANRVHFTEVLDNLLTRSRGRHSPCTLMFIDLDRFKIVNDTLGHPVGDELLKEVARRIEYVVKGQGRAGRLGGDEFVVALQDTSKKVVVERLAARLIAELSAPYHIGRSKIQIGASIGLATAPEHGLTSGDLIRHADLALYRSKEAGRGKYHFYETSLGETAENRRSLEVDLREALARDELRLVYQPIFELESGMVAGFEALLRWAHPTRGLISPEEFVPIAEECGLIVPVGDWALRTALVAASDWPYGVKIAVNLSPVQLQDPGLSVSVMNALAASQIASERVELEITESVFLQETPTTQENLQRLERLGLRFSLDDFGTGYSSLGYLRRGLFSKIKIDRSFVQGVEFRNSGDRSIVKAVIALANSLGMISTAEGAETEKQLNALREMGCKQVQGFAAGKPLDLESATLLAHSASAGIGERAFVQRPSRHGMLKRIQLEVNGKRLKAVLRNISPYGAMITTAETLELGTKIELKLPSIGCPIGLVRWTSDDHAGLEFECEVELEPLSEFARNEGLETRDDGRSSSVVEAA